MNHITIHPDKISRPKDYANLSGLLVTSVFRTIQGEGPFAGMPAVFIRLAGCNFGDKQDHCFWCDSFFGFDAGKHYSFPVIADTLKALPGYAKSDILVVTGGEPTLQHNLRKFIRYIREDFKTVQIETNGTQASFFEEPVNMEFYTVVSPKASAKLKGYAPLSKTVMAETDCLKFVVSANPEDPQHTVPDWAFASRKLLYVSPMAVYRKGYVGEVSSIWDAELVDQAETAKNYAYAAKYAMDNHCLLSLQTHLFTAVP